MRLCTLTKIVSLMQGHNSLEAKVLFGGEKSSSDANLILFDPSEPAQVMVLVSIRNDQLSLRHSLHCSIETLVNSRGKTTVQPSEWHDSTKGQAEDTSGPQALVQQQFSSVRYGTVGTVPVCRQQRTVLSRRGNASLVNQQLGARVIDYHPY